MALESQMVVLFGSTGDLTRRKLIPALYELLRKGELSSCTPIVCVGRRPYDKRQFIEHLELERFIKDAESGHLAELVRRIEYLEVDLSSMDSEQFKRKMVSIKNAHQCTSNMLFYLSVSPELFGPIVRLIGPLKALKGFKRVVFEKPFGTDRQSAQELNAAVRQVFSEPEMFRIDHYLGKELVRNILALRFANSMFEKVWHNSEVDCVQLTVAENLGVETRAGYYDGAGAVRDMVQNHLLQVLSLVAMEPPASLAADDVRDRTAEVMRHLVIPRADDIVFGQYGKGFIEGEKVAGYRDEHGVAKGSSTETFAAIRLFIDTPRWEGVPFYLRTGKRLAQRQADIKIVFKHTSSLFSKVEEHDPNMIAVRIHPDEGVSVRFNAKRPGEGMVIEPVEMDFCHPCHFGPNSPEAYESLLAQVMKGDATLFTRWDWLEASWRFTDALREAAGEPLIYPAGSMGPKEAEMLLAMDGRRWV